MTHATERTDAQRSITISGSSGASITADADARTLKRLPSDAEDGDEPSEGGPPPGDSSDDGDDQEEVLPKDVRFDILKNRRRRLVLQYLIENDNPVSLGTLSEYVAAVENDKSRSALNSRERKRAYVGLYQCHLPRMHDADVVDFDQDRGRVELGEHAEDIAVHLTEDSADGHEWARRYLLLATFGGGGYLIGNSSVVGSSWVGTAVVGVVLAAFFATSLVHLRREQAAD